MNRVMEIKEKILDILKKYGVKRAAVFGSFARGDFRADSDIDLIVELEEGRSLLDLAGLKIEIEERLGKRVDILTFNSINPFLKEQIFREKIELL